ncbi:MAG: HEPN-associated N-terminal domain-containing protein [Parvularcula sp.]|jgi:hypothetical protein|nr:HEPN-associated N-terminal domain-containing protein [Parvularcula sp.]
MGRLKDYIIELETRGYGEVDGSICSDCVEDDALKKWIGEHLCDNECRFCENKSDRPIAASFEDFVGIVLNGIRFDYNDPDDEGIMYVSREGGYQAPTYDSWDIMAEYDIGSEAVEDELVNVFIDKMWVQRDFYYGTRGDHLAFGWESFKEFVKHRSRYFFLQETSENRSEISPSEMLDTIARLMSSRLGAYDLVVSIDEGAVFYRVRLDDNAHTTADQIGPPQVQFATQSNRMSPAGIPMFYGAYDVETAIAETFDPKMGTDKIMSIGTFESLRQLRLLNLVDLPPVPSVFDEMRRGLIHSLRFLNGFAQSIAASIDRDGYEHIEYVPTQVVTEYFRRLFIATNGDTLDGIVYRSSREAGQRAIVLFCENQNCIDANVETRDNSILRLKSVEHRACSEM